MPFSYQVKFYARSTKVVMVEFANLIKRHWKKKTPSRHKVRRKLWENSIYSCFPINFIHFLPCFVHTHTHKKKYSFSFMFELHTQIQSWKKHSCLISNSSIFFALFSCLCVHTSHSTCMKSRRRLTKSGSLFSPQELNSGHLVWW